MLDVYGKHGEGVKARDFFDWMIKTGYQPNNVTLGCLLDAYSHSGLVDDALQVFENMEAQFNILLQL